MSVVVFLGPSLPLKEARSLLDADYRAPARAGDVYAASLGDPQAIGIIDGLFEAVPAVWHKEILHALAKGIPVYGASSMGALRAAELHTFGMRGVGRIFEGFVAGELEDDDEVALVHAPEIGKYQSISEPMANIREGLQRARASDLISQHTHDLLLGIAKAQFYPDRSWPKLDELGIEAGAATEEMERLVDFVRQERPDQKGEDARKLLRRMAKDGADGFRPFEPDFELERSIFFHRLAETTEQRLAADPRSDPATGTPLRPWPQR
ncbi:MAG: tfuA protein [bacterium]|nr:tfuA protein [bacterium]